MRDPAASAPAPLHGTEPELLAALGARSVVLIGMMGAGKTSVGRRLAARLGIPFVDADQEIEAAADMRIAEIFAAHGEAYFRAGEARVIARLLETGPQVLATGGGAYMNEQTRARIAEKGVSVWLNADLEVLLRRVKRRAVGDRPMLKSDPAESLKELITLRYPIYAMADLTVTSREVAHEVIVGEVIAALKQHCGAAKGQEQARS